METSLIVFVDHSNAQAMIMYSKHNTNVNNASDKWSKWRLLLLLLLLMLIICKLLH